MTLPAVLRWAIAVAAVLAVGGAALAPALRSSGWRGRLAELPRIATVGTVLLTLAAFGLVRLGGRLGPLSIFFLAAALIVVLTAGQALASGGIRPPVPPQLREPSGRPGSRSSLIALAAYAPALVALTAFGWKLAAVRLWSWDHYAIWGVKARALLAGGALDLDWLAAAGASVRADYPLGVPVAWRTLTLGGEPREVDFLIAHGLAAWALVGATAAAARRLSGSPLVAGAVAGLVAASPLLWDTESAGLADLPLALCAVVAAWPLAGGAPAAEDEGLAGLAALWPAGVCAGFLPWIKTEGWTLAVLLVLATGVHLARGRPAGPRRRLRRLAVYLGPAAAVALGAGLAVPGVGERQAGFFRGDWAGRGAARLAELPRLAGRLAGELSAAGWLGAWALVAVALAVAAVLAARGGGAGAVRWEADLPQAAADRRRAALGLGGVAGAQLAVYAGTYLVSYIPWQLHVATSFYRVSAALLPLALLAAAAAAGNTAPGRRR